VLTKRTATSIPTQNTGGRPSLRYAVSQKSSRDRRSSQLPAGRRLQATSDSFDVHVLIIAGFAANSIRTTIAATPVAELSNELNAVITHVCRPTALTVHALPLHSLHSH
jgi:hypothetical protein